jgi:hypothetical protein
MNKAFEEYLLHNGVDTDTLLEAFRTYLSEQTDYLPPEDMQTALSKMAVDANGVKNLLKQLANDSDSLLGAAHIVLGTEWDDLEKRELIKDTIETAKKKLPVIELNILAIVAMYGMYLITTGGVREKKQTTILPGGGIKIESTVYEPPTAPLKMIVDLFMGADRTERRDS